MPTDSPRPHRPHPDQAMSYEEFYRELFADKKRPAAPAPPRPARPFNPANPEEISTEEFYRQLFARDSDQAPQEPPTPAPQAPERFQEMSTEEFFRELFATPEKPLALGPRAGLTPPALPARFQRVRGGNQVVNYELLVAEDGRIAAKHENVAGSESYCIYEYDAAGHLLRAWRDGALAEEYAYDPRGARVASWNPGQGQWKYGYDERGRLASAGPWRFAYAGDGSLREAWTSEYAFRLPDNQDGGQPRTVLSGGRVLRSETVAPGLPTEKYIDAAPVESFTWRSPLQLAFYRDHQRGVRMQFHSAGQGRLPQAVTVQDPHGTTTYLLGYDQVGSLKAVAAMDGEHEGRVVKVVDYDAFGNVLTDSNPRLFMPIAFAGGLRDRFTGLVRFCHRDYDPTVGRFTAPDPLGDTGGDHDLYDYCVDEPVSSFDPSGLVSENVQRVEKEAKPSATPSADTGKYAIFDKGKETLEVHDGQGTNVWNATSGPHGNGALPSGNYTIGGNIPKTLRNKPFCDPQGSCFSYVITPGFPTDRTELRIHPDGGTAGTAGCIGVKDCDTKSLFKSLKGMRGRQLEVR